MNLFLARGKLCPNQIGDRSLFIHPFGDVTFTKIEVEAVINTVALDIKTEVSYYAFSTQPRHICIITQSIWKQQNFIRVTIWLP